MNTLLELLNENFGLTNEKIAVMLGRTKESIDEEISRYEKDGIIKGYKAVINWDKVDASQAYALIELRINPKKDRGFDEVAERIVPFEEVESVYLMAGQYDLAV